MNVNYYIIRNYFLLQRHMLQLQGYIETEIDLYMFERRVISMGRAYVTVTS